jgi:hypothetical protein
MDVWASNDGANVPFTAGEDDTNGPRRQGVIPDVHVHERVGTDRVTRLGKFSSLWGIYLEYFIQTKSTLLGLFFNI